MEENEKYLFEANTVNDNEDPAEERRDSFSLRIGGTFYDVTTHLKTGGTRTVLN